MKKWLLGLAMICLLLLLANALAIWWVERGVASRIAAIRARGAATSLADLEAEAQAVSEVDNAAVILLQMQPRLETFHAAHQALLKTEDFADEVPDGGPRPITTAAQLAAGEALLAEYADLEPLVAAAASCESYGSQADFSQTPQQIGNAQIALIQAMRAAARLNDLRMGVLVARDRPDEAVARGLELLKLARLFEAEPGLVNYFASVAARGVACRGIARALDSGSVSSATRQALDAELALNDDLQKLARALGRERAFFMTMIEKDLGDQSALAGLLGWYSRRHLTDWLDFYDGAVGAVGQPWQQMVSSRVLQSASNDYVNEFFAPTVRAASEAGYRDVAQVRALRVLNALEQFAATNGHEATGLADLKLPAAATVDPFSGQPLVLKRTEAGWLVYSVGRDGKDGGGDVKDMMNDVGFGPSGEYHSRE